jgi:hypothetical protein
MSTFDETKDLAATSGFRAHFHRQRGDLRRLRRTIPRRQAKGPIISVPGEGDLAKRCDSIGQKDLVMRGSTARCAADVALQRTLRQLVLPSGLGFVSFDDEAEQYLCAAVLRPAM